MTNPNFKANNKFKADKRIEGSVKRHPDGFGFLLPDKADEPDVYLPRNTMTGIMTNDKVLASITKENGSDRWYGEIIRITQRANTKVFGVYHQINDNFGVLHDQENHWGEDLKIPTRMAKSAKDGELVSVKITSYPGETRGFSGEVTDIIGDAEDPLLDIQRAVLTYHIPQEFSAECLTEAKRIPKEVSPQDIEGRKDLRSFDLVTIDGITAKDFDDAVYVENNAKGFRALIAIADVSHYVKSGSAIDKDAVIRGNSSYFPGFVIPMLPEELSNELCSLKPKVDRLCMVADLQIGFDGEIDTSDFYEAVMNSKARITYGEAQEIVDGNDTKYPENIQKAVKRAADLSKILMAKRFRDGSLDLEIPETELIIDETGMPTDIVRSERLFAHRLIEELMLIANIAVARFIGDRQTPSIFRIHETPDQEKLSMLERYIYNFGGDAHLEGGKLQKKLTKVLQKFEGKPEYQILNTLVLRSMKQARYSAENKGHFGLNFTHYSHFTSPIRRYPDLIIHRTVKALIKPKSGYFLYGSGELETFATNCSATEQRSVKAERLLKSIKRSRFIASHIGEEFEGIITSVTRFGVFVGLRQYDVDGLVKTEQLGREAFIFDEEKLELIGKNSLACYKLGMPLKIIVAAANTNNGQIDFVLSKDNEIGTAEKRPTDRKNDKKRKPSKDDSKRSGKKRFSRSGGKNKSR